MRQEQIALLNLVLTAAGPLFAVLITQWLQNRSKTRDERVEVLRMLMSTRGRVHDPAFLTAISMIPVEFNSVPTVMDAWRGYMREANALVPEDHAEMQGNRTHLQLTALIHAITQKLRYKVTESELKSTVYVPRAFIEREALYAASLRATCAMSDTLQQQLGVMAPAGQRAAE